MSGDRLHEALDQAREQRARDEAIDVSALAATFGVSAADLGDALLALDALEGGSARAVKPLPLPELPDAYELGPELGRGGMGIVYRARQRSLNRQVAVKVLRPGEIVFGEALARFQREARVLAKLRHPHIVPIHEVGESNGLVYFAMDLFEGGSLADLLGKKRRPMPVARVVRLMRQVAGAVAFVHRHGMVHRDLKPANVLLDEQGDAFVADFGLAVDPSEGATLTASGGLLGTPDYMAPEQARGDRALISERTDVYALGVMLYECLTGRAPFAGRTLIDKIHAVVHEEPPAPRKVASDVPIELERVCLQAMAKEPEDRYTTASALATDLERFEQGLPVAARGASRGARLVRSARRHRGRLAAGLVGAAAAATVLYVGGFGALPSSLEDRLADAQQLEAAGEQSAADLLYVNSLDELRGAELDDEVSRALALHGLLAGLRAHDRAPRMQQASVADSLQRDADWFAREMGNDSIEAWLVRVAAAERAGDARSITERFRGWLQDRRQGRGSPASSVREAFVALGPYVRTADHPLVGPASFALWELAEHLPPSRETAGPGPWRHMVLALAQRSLRDWGDHASLQTAWLTDSHAMASWLGAERFHPDLEEGLLGLVEGRDADDIDRERAVSILAWTLGVPAPLRQVDDPANASNKSRRAFHAPSFVRFAQALRATRDEPEEARRKALGDAYVAMLDDMDSDGLEGSLFISPWFRSTLGVAAHPSDIERLSSRWADVRDGDLREPLLAALEIDGGLTPFDAARRLGDEPDDERAAWLHEFLLLSVDDPRSAPVWLHLRGPGMNRRPSELTGAWLAYLGEDPFGGPHRVEFALVLWPAGEGAPQLVASWSDTLDTGDRSESAQGFSLPSGFRGHDPRGPLSARPLRSAVPAGHGRVVTATTLEHGSSGVLARFTAHVDLRIAGTMGSSQHLTAPDHRLAVHHGRTAALAEGLLAWSSGVSNGLPAHRVALLARLVHDEEQRPPLGADLDRWTRALADELILLGGQPQEGNPVTDEARRTYWESQSPLTTARLLQGEPNRDLSARVELDLGYLHTGLGRGMSSDVARHARAVTLALGRVDDKAVRPMVDWLRSKDWSNLDLPLSGLLAASDDESIRAAAASDFSEEDTTLGELAQVERVWREAGTALPREIERAVERSRWRQGLVHGHWLMQSVTLLAAVLGALCCWFVARRTTESVLVAAGLCLATGAMGALYLDLSLGESHGVSMALGAAASYLAALAARRGWRPSSAALCVLALALGALAQWAPLPEAWHLLASLAVIAAVLDLAIRLGRAGAGRAVWAGALAWMAASLPVVVIRLGELFGRHGWTEWTRSALPGESARLFLWGVSLATLAAGIARVSADGTTRAVRAPSQVTSGT